MLTEGTGEVFDAPRHLDARRIERGKLYRIPDAVAPQSRIVGKNERVVHPDFHFTQREPCRVFVEVFIRRNKLEEDAAVDVEQQSIGLLRILKREETFACRIQLNDGNALADERFEFGAVWFEVDAAVYKQIEIGKHVRNGLLA